MLAKRALLTLVGCVFVIHSQTSCRSGKNSGDSTVQLKPQACVQGNPTALCAADASQLDVQALRKEVVNIFTSECAACHAGGNRQGGFGDVLNFDILTRADSKYVKVGEPEKSLLFTRMNAANQPMPPKGLLSKAQIDSVRRWIVAEGNAASAIRERVKMADVFRTIREDFDRQQNRKDLRYIHFVNLWNSGVTESEIQRHREALSKLLNMLSTRNRIEKPVAIDGKGLLYRVDLSEYDLHIPFGLNPPENPAVRIGRWKEVFESRRPARDTAAEDAFFVANFQVVPPEYKATGACDKSKPVRPYQCDSNLQWMKSVMTLNNANPIAGGTLDAVLQDYIANAGTQQTILQNETEDFVTLPSITAAGGSAGSFAIGILNKDGTKRRSADNLLPPVVLLKNPGQSVNAAGNQISYSQEHTPLPLIRGDWFIFQVLGNYKQRVYYHLAGIPADTGVLDIALGIDDEGALMRDNAPDPSSGIRLSPIIMRSGFTDSGVSQNHRILERIETQQFTDKALWRSYEFEKADEGVNKYQHALKYPFGPILFDNNDPTVLGYECLNMFTNPNDVFKDASGGILFDWARKYWTQTPINFDYLRPTRKADPSKLSAADKAIYDSFWNADGTAKPLPPNTLACDSVKNGKDVREADKAFDFHGFEYQFMRPNGLQGFATVALNAFITDFKIPSDEAFKTTRAVFATSDSGQKIVTQPLSCLSCHSRGLIDKRDAVAPFVKANQGANGFSKEQVEKVERIYVAPEKFTDRLEKDNKIIQTAIAATGAEITDEEPNVAAYKRFVSRVKLEVLASDAGVTPETLRKIIQEAQTGADAALYSDLVALTVNGGDVLRETSEKHLPRIIELASLLGLFE
ncbi:MAG: hypothetical protein RLZZ488_99 [Pseudomonadota bacterium]|jgi:mono/diheme cytochrome c family protein